MLIIIGVCKYILYKSDYNTVSIFKGGYYIGTYKINYKEEECYIIYNYYTMFNYFSGMLFFYKTKKHGKIC